VHGLKRRKYFLVYEISFLSLMAALVYIFKTFFKTPIQLPAHTAIVWVIPYIIGIGLTKKFGAGTYIGVIAGLLMGTIGMADKGPFEVFEWTAMGLTMDVAAMMFRGHLANPLVGVILGALGSFDKTLVNYFITAQILHSTPLLIAGIGIAGTVSLTFGGAGGAISAAIVNRIQHVHFPSQAAKKKERPETQLVKALELT
jgi:hypothetical protein